jgi:hypothetical protein
LIDSPRVGDFLFWFFFIVTIAWTVIALIVKAYKLLKGEKR